MIDNVARTAATAEEQDGDRDDRGHAEQTEDRRGAAAPVDGRRRRRISHGKNLVI